MNILTELVSLLADEKESLTNALYKLKILAVRVSNQELLKWVNQELNGYDSNEKLPEYRKTPGILKGSFHNGFQAVANQNIPTFGFPEELINYVSKVSIIENISIVEDRAKKEEETVRIAIPAEITAFIMEYLKKNNSTARGYTLYNNYIIINTAAYKNIISRIRNNALDLTLALEKEVGLEVDIEEVIKKKDKINQVIHNHMSNITNIGDGNLVNTGDHNDITQNTVIQKGNFEQLKQALSQAGLDSKDIDELENIIKDDNTNVEKKELGDGVKQWLKQITLKYWDKGKKIGLGVITHIASKLIEMYLFGA